MLAGEDNALAPWLIKSKISIWTIDYTINIIIDISSMISYEILDIFDTIYIAYTIEM